MEGGRKGGVKMVVDVGSKEMEDGRNAAIAEDGRLSLAVRDAGEEAVGGGGESGRGIEKIGVGERETAKGMAEEPYAGGQFWGRGGVGRVKDIKGGKEGGTV